MMISRGKPKDFEENLHQYLFIKDELHSTLPRFKLGISALRNLLMISGDICVHWRRFALP
jgi:hypothetical protein